MPRKDAGTVSRVRHVRPITIMVGLVSLVLVATVLGAVMSGRTGGRVVTAPDPAPPVQDGRTVEAAPTSATPSPGTIPVLPSSTPRASSGASRKPDNRGGPPSTSSPGSFVERAGVRTYALTGLRAGASGNPRTNGDRLRVVLAGARPGDVITVAPGRYLLAGAVDFPVRDITLKGLGATRKDVFFEHTTEKDASFRIKAGGVHLYNFTHRVHATARSSQAQMGEGDIWVEGGHKGFRMQDVLAWGSRDAAVFLFRVHDFELNRVESRDSRSDAFHISYGSSYGRFYDSVSRNSGDDGMGFVGYDAEGAGTPHHHTVVRHHVAGQSWGRGIGLIHVNNITFHGTTLIEDTAGAGVILAREPHYGSGAVRGIRFLGELRLRRANSHPAIEHGAVHIHNADTVAPIEDVVFTGPIVAVDTGKNRPGGVWYQFRAHGPGRITAEIANARFYGVGPAYKLDLALAAGSSVTTPGWSNATPYGGAEPPFPLP